MKGQYTIVGFGKNRLKNRKIRQERTAGAVSVLLRQDA
jgi:hypothetical protein